MTLDDRVRDRIFGGICLLALAGIVLPMVFDGAGVAELGDVNVTVPVKAAPPVPALETTSEAWGFVKTARQLRADGPLVPPLASARGHAEGNERTALGDPQSRAPDTMSPTGRELPWTVQVASFTALDKGKALTTRLLGDGFHAYVTQGVGGDKRPIVRVAVGPFVVREEAEKVLAKLQTRYGLSGILKRFDL